MRLQYNIQEQRLHEQPGLYSIDNGERLSPGRLPNLMEKMEILIALMNR